jgi:hypothetical protein
MAAYDRRPGAAPKEAVMPDRPRRGLGPFTGTQLTVIIVTFAVLLLAPVGAWAVTGSSSFVTDAGSGQHAFVSRAGQLNVTRAGAKSFLSHVANVSGPNLFPVVASPPGKALVITGLSVDAFVVPHPGIEDSIDFYISAQDATCARYATANGAILWGVNPPTVGTTSLSLDPGVVVPAGRALCAVNQDHFNFGASEFVYGYTVPAAAAPNGT